MSTDPLLSWRAEFPILDRTVYMISHSLGAMPRRTRDRLKQYADEWDTRGIRAWEEGWWEMPITIGNLVGRIIGAGPGEVVMQQNVSICQAIVAGCFDWTAKRNTIVTEDMNFPSNLYIYQQSGARLVTVPSPDGVTVPVERMLNAIDENTALVFSPATGNAITVADADAGTAVIQLTLTAANGALTLGDSAAITLVDGTGAGDAFVAGFLPPWLDKKPPVEALGSGCRLAAHALNLIGARPML